MSFSLPGLLSRDQVDHARRLGQAIRKGQVATLVGAGLSVDAGLLSWDDLGRQLILAWREWDPTPRIRELHPDNYIKFVRATFRDDLAFVSYLRRTLPSLQDSRRGPAPDFSTLLYQALYSDPDRPGQYLYPQPSDVHRHLIALFAECPGCLWTTNYDDLLERAAADLGHQTVALDPEAHRLQRGLPIIHLHGYLPPVSPARTATEMDTRATVVLAEDDYHLVAANQLAWIGHEFYQLFEEHRVLVLGMSLVDPNLRRVLATVAVDDTTPEPPHYAVLTPVPADALPLKRVHSTTRERLAAGVVRVRADYWKRYGVGIVDLPSYDSILPFIVRLRYESAGPGELWRQGAALGYGAIRPWSATRQAEAQNALAKVIDRMQRAFDVPPGEIVDVGIFLVRPDALDLELVFRTGQSPPPSPGGRTFQIEPDAPTGAAGVVFTTGRGLMVRLTDQHYNFGAPPSTGSTASIPYEGIILAPLVDWPNGGVLIGVIYTSVSTTTGRLFSSNEKEIVGWLQAAGNSSLAALQPS